MGMTLDEARELLASPLWGPVRDHFLAGNEFVVHPAGDLRRLDYLDEELRRKIARWCDAAAHLAEWKKVVDGRDVRALKTEFADVYPEILRYGVYFAKCAGDEDRTRTVLRLKFPDVQEMLER